MFQHIDEIVLVGMPAHRAGVFGIANRVVCRRNRLLLVVVAIFALPMVLIPRGNTCVIMGTLGFVHAPSGVELKGNGRHEIALVGIPAYRAGVFGITRRFKGRLRDNGNKRMILYVADFVTNIADLPVICLIIFVLFAIRMEMQGFRRRGRRTGFGRTGRGGNGTADARRKRIACTRGRSAAAIRRFLRRGKRSGGSFGRGRRTGRHLV